VKSPYEILLRPVITERANILGESPEGAQYVFEVAPKANKVEIGRAVEAIYKVKVKRVNTIKVKGKLKRQGRHQGLTASWKKAFVVLQKGQKIELLG
jgi:large subunit ribosomal protein L23